MKTVFFDVDTQLDFVYPGGALYVPGAENIVENLGMLTRYAAARCIQIICTADAHAENDAEFKDWKPHCVAGTVGQQKCAATLLPGISPEWSALQILIEKQQLNCFSNPTLRPLLKSLAAERYVVYGLVSEYCVQHAVLGLLETGAQVELVSDAIRCLDKGAERALIETLIDRGGRVITSRALTEGI